MATAQAAQIALAIWDYVWLAPLPPALWYLRRTHIDRTIVTVIRGEVRDRWLRSKGVPADERRKLAVDTVRRDLDS
jgi:hypothetical protein